jgi:uncharacterized protein (TIGR02147 family)
MKGNVFDYRDYKKYLVDSLDARPGGGRGSRSALAEATGCQTAYVSQVLNGNANFSLEQADLINKFLGHAADEADFFLLLVQHGRAGTHSLRSYFMGQINKILEKRLVIKDRLDVKKALSREDQVLYYSNWLYAMVHVMLSIPEFQNREAIAKYLGLPLQRVSEILDFLLSVGLAKRDQGRFKIGDARLHLGSDSAMFAKHHTNWRVQAMRSLDRSGNDDTHYSSVVTLTKEDAVKIRLMIIDFIKEVKVVVKEAKEEEVHAFCLDFFQV